MDKTSIIDQSRKNQVEERLVQIMINAYQAKKLSYFEMKKIGSYIITHLDNVKTQEQLTSFIGNVAHYWDIFKNQSVIEQQNQMSSKEQEVIKKLSDYVKTFN